MSDELKVVVTYLAIHELKLDSRRLRRRGKGQIEQLASNIRRFGLIVPVIITPDGTIIDGHAIVEAAREAGLKQIPTIALSHLNEAELRACRIALNRIQEMSIWDEAELKREVEFLIEVDLDLVSFTGFTTPQIDFILDPVGRKPKVDAADILPEPLETIVSRSGDVWIFKGGHRLVCGDARDPATFLILMAGGVARVAICDLPYNVRIRGNVSGQACAREFAMASGEMTEAEFTIFLRTIFTNVAAHCINGAFNFQFMDWRHMGAMLAAGESVYTELKNLCVWHKTNAGMGSLWRSQHELCFVWKVGTASHINNVELGRHGRNRSNMWEYSGGSSALRRSDAAASEHPTPKCVAMIADSIMDVTERNDIVLDATVGSGTTLVAAHRTKRRGYGIEIDPAYVDLAVRRLEASTKAPACHAGTGETFAEVAAERLRASERTLGVADGQASFAPTA